MSLWVKPNGILVCNNLGKLIDCNHCPCEKCDTIKYPFAVQYCYQSKAHQFSSTSSVTQEWESQFYQLVHGENSTFSDFNSLFENPRMVKYTLLE